MKRSSFIIVILCTLSLSILNADLTSNLLIRKAIKQYQRKRFNPTSIAPIRTWALRKSPGFEQTWQAYQESRLHNDECNGHLYELQVAVEFAQCLEKKEILELNQIKECPNTGLKREFDIIVKQDDREYWIECKAGNWKNFHNPSQLLEQKIIAHNFANRHNKKIVYLILSKQHISSKWKKWFNQTGIMTIEDN